MEELFGIIGVISLPLSIGFAIAWWNARKELHLRRQINLELGVRPQIRPEARPESRRLEEAVEAMALEVERLAEGQRFVAKVLTERSNAERGRERPGSPVITPH